jgi:carboxylesterase type B
MARLVTDGQFVCENRRLARYISEEHTPVFLFSYDYVIDAVFPGRAIHGVESNILFGNNYVPAQFPNHVLTQADTALHERMAGYWTRFARNGNPNVDDDTVVHWPLFKDPNGEGRGANRHLVLNDVIASGKRLRESQCDFWEPLFLRSMLGGVPAGKQ